EEVRSDQPFPDEPEHQAELKEERHRGSHEDHTGRARPDPLSRRRFPNLSNNCSITRSYAQTIDVRSRTAVLARSGVRAGASSRLALSTPGGALGSARHNRAPADRP